MDQSSHVLMNLCNKVVFLFLKNNVKVFGPGHSSLIPKGKFKSLYLTIHELVLSEKKIV